jgi:hypothetical protein
MHCAVQGCPIYAVHRDAQTDEVGTRCVCICMYVCMHAMYVCMYVCTYVCMVARIILFLNLKKIPNTDQSYASIKKNMGTIQNLHININPVKVKHAVIFGSVRIMYVSMYVCMYE